MIPKETIALIRERTDIVALIGESVRLIRSGRSWKGLCPFHKEKSGSFYVHPERGFFHCFGCGESGSGIDFVMKQNGLDFREAAIMLADRAGVRIEEVRESQTAQSGPSRDDLYAANGHAAAFFETQLGLGAATRHKAAHHAVRELERRGMPKAGTASEPAQRWAQTIQAFRIGYAPPEWDSLAQHFKKQGISIEVAERAGLLVPRATGSGHYDRFRHRLMFAVADTLGRVVAFTGRALEQPTAADLSPGAPAYDGEAPARYINSPESAVYTKGQHLFGLYQAKQALRARGSSLLVEGNFDVVSLHARGLEHAVAPLGTAFTPEQAKLLKRFAPKVVIAFDGDAAGRKATRAARAAVREGGLEARAIRLPTGVDPDDFVRKKGTEALLALEASATGLLEYLISDALDGEEFGGATLTERIARVRSVAKLLTDEDDPSLRLMAKRYADQLSARLVLDGKAPEDLAELERLISSAVSGGSSHDRGSRGPSGGSSHDRGSRGPSGGPHDRGSRGPSGDRPPQKNPPIHIDRSKQEQILGALLDAPALLGDSEVERAVSEVSGDVALAIVALRQHLSANQSRKLAPEVLLASVPRSIHSFAAQRLACAAFESDADAKANLLENARKLQDSSRARETATAVVELARASSALTPETEALLREVEQRARKRRGLNE